MVIDNDPPFLVLLYTRLVQTKAVGEGPASGADENVVCGESLLGTSLNRLDRDLTLSGKVFAADNFVAN